MPLEPSALRYITAFELGEPFLFSYKDSNDARNSEVQRQLEFAVIKVGNFPLNILIILPKGVLLNDFGHNTLKLNMP